MIKIMQQLPKSFWFLVVIALAVKAGLYIFIAVTNPDSILEFDSYEYLSRASVLAGGFRGDDISHAYNIFRTPGYPFFLMVFHHWLRVPLIGVIGIQLVLNILAAWVTAKSAERLDPELIPVSALIILLDFPTTVFSLMILTEAVFLLLMSILLYSGVRYLQDHRMRWVLIASLTLTAAVYMRPAAYYLPLMTGGLMAADAVLRHRGSRLKLLMHAFLLLFIAYGLVFCWQLRNYKTTGQFKFSSIDQATLNTYGLIGRYARGDISNKIDAESMHPVVYYIYTTSRHVVDLMGEPGSLKYFDCAAIRSAGKVFGYLTILFWLPGFLAGIFRMGRQVHFWFMLAMVAYFVAVTILAVGWETTPRFRVPMMPFIAVMSAYGWIWIAPRLKSKNENIRS